MPRGDGTGPSGGGGGGRGSGGSGGGGGRKGGSFAAGPGGNCVCPKCGKKIAHAPGQPCYQITCPDCGITMIRE